MRGMRHTARHLKQNKQKQTRQMLARQHPARPMNQQVVEKILARHGR